MRRLILVALSALLLVFGGSVMAQDDQFCGGLGEEDCALLADSTEATANIGSSAYTLSADVIVTGTEEEGSISFVASGEFIGAFGMLDEEALNSTDIAVALGAVTDVLAGFSGTMNISLNASGAAAAEFPAEGITLNLALIEGIGYIDFSTLTPLLGPEGGDQLAMLGIPNGWAGLDIPDVVDGLVGFLGGMGGMEGMGEVETEGELSEEQMADLATALESYIVIERVDDSEGFAVFVTTVDVAGLLQDPTFQELLVTAGGVAGTDVSELSEIAPQLGEAISLTVTQQVNLETLYQEVTAFDISLDASVIDPEETGTLAITGALVYSNIDGVSEIAAPDGPVAGFSDVLGLLMAGGF